MFPLNLLTLEIPFHSSFHPCLSCCWYLFLLLSWWRHQIETFSALLAFVRGIHRIHRWIPVSQRPVKRCFDVFFDLCMKLSKQWWDWWFETPSCSLWRHCYVEAGANIGDIDVFPSARGGNVSKTLTYYPWDQHKTSYLNHDDVIKWKYFPCYWPFVSKQSWGWWFETPARPLWRQCNVRLHWKVPFLWNANLWPIVAMKVVIINISSPNQDIQMRKSILCVHYRADTTDITHFHRQQTVSFNACN